MPREPQVGFIQEEVSKQALTAQWGVLSRLPPEQSLGVPVPESALQDDVKDAQEFGK